MVATFKSRIKKTRFSARILLLKRDAQGKITRLIQERLNFVGFNLKIDGIFGINTEKAVKKFQNNRNLKVDGIVGKKTWSYLIKGIKV